MTRENQMSQLAKKITQWDITQGGVPQEWLDEYGALWAEEQREKDLKKAKKSLDMKNRRRRGKYAERTIAKQTGGIRKGGVAQEDVKSGMFSFEVKHVRKFAAKAEKGLAEAVRHKGSSDVAGYIEKCGKESRIYLDWKDWLDLHGAS